MAINESKTNILLLFFKNNFMSLKIIKLPTIIPAGFWCVLWRCSVVARRWWSDSGRLLLIDVKILGLLVVVRIWVALLSEWLLHKRLSLLLNRCWYRAVFSIWHSVVILVVILVVSRHYLSRWVVWVGCWVLVVHVSLLVWGEGGFWGDEILVILTKMNNSLINADIWIDTALQTQLLRIPHWPKVRISSEMKKLFIIF